MAVTLVESDQRKAAFLMTAARELGLKIWQCGQNASNHCRRFWQTFYRRGRWRRLNSLIGHAERHLSPEGDSRLFPKGASHAAEVKQALEKLAIFIRNSAKRYRRQRGHFSDKGGFACLIRPGQKAPE